MTIATFLTAHLPKFCLWSSMFPIHPILLHFAFPRNTPRLEGRVWAWAWRLVLLCWFFHFQMPYPCLKISFGVGQVLEHIRALSTMSCRRSWEAHGSDLDSLPSSCHVSMQLLWFWWLWFGHTLDNFQVSPCPPSSIWQAACAFFFFQIVVGRDRGSIFPFCFSYFIATKDLPSITITVLWFACPLYKLWVSPHPPRGDWQAELVSFFINCGCKLRRGVSFLLFIATKDFACISYIFLVRPYFPPPLPLLSFAWK